MPASKIDRSDVLAILAILISFTSLGLGIYEANIMKQETEIMLQQQKTSVWPYINKNTNFTYTDHAEINYSMTNKGVGPALIKAIILEKDGVQTSTKYGNILQLFNPILAEIDQLEQNDYPLNISTSFESSIIVSPGEKIDLLKLSCSRFPNDAKTLSALMRSLKMKICYTSIYDDSWLLEDDTKGPQPIESCDLVE